MRLELNDTINKLVNTKFLTAKSSGGLVFSFTELAIIRSRGGLPFQLRYCPALSKKPEPGKSEPQESRPEPQSGSKPNPFEHPAEALLVARLPSEQNATHNLVLNKYPVIANHSILTTIGFQKQTDLLESQDLEVTYACLKAWETESTDGSPSRLFAFFNSGQHSGASQPHRHLQLLPVHNMMDSDSPRNVWQPLIDSMTRPCSDNSDILTIPSLPFCHYAMAIPKNPEEGELKRIYHRLYDRARWAVRLGNVAHPPEDVEVDLSYPTAAISYNLAMTTHAMAICPRRNESAPIPTKSGNGSVAVNGTILCGTLMVKEPSDWQAMKDSEVMIDDILQEIGFTVPNEVVDPRSGRL